LVFDVTYYDKNLFSKSITGIDMIREMERDLLVLNSRLSRISGEKRQLTTLGKEVREAMLKEGEEVRKRIKEKKDTIEEAIQETADNACDLIMRFTFTLMCHFVKERPQEVGGETKENYIRNTGIKSTYRYNGKVNVLDNRVYKLTTTLAEKKEFIRHIGRWVVRGHWRQYKNDVGVVVKTIWIAEYLKGEGRLEKREYVFDSNEVNRKANAVHNNQGG